MLSVTTGRNNQSLQQASKSGAFDPDGVKSNSEADREYPRNKQGLSNRAAPDCLTRGFLLFSVQDGNFMESSI